MEMPYIQVDRTLVFMMIWMESHIEGLGMRGKRQHVAPFKKWNICQGYFSILAS